MKQIIEFFRAIFSNPVMRNDLDEYIRSGNPQTEQDVINLTKEFEQQRSFLTRYND